MCTKECRTHSNINTHIVWNFLLSCELSRPRINRINWHARFALINYTWHRVFVWVVCSHPMPYNTITNTYIDKIKSRIIIIFWLSFFRASIISTARLFRPPLITIHRIFRLCFTWVNRIILIFLMHFKCNVRNALAQPILLELLEKIISILRFCSVIFTQRIPA